MARTRSSNHPMPPEGSWLKFQLDLRNIKLAAVAEKAHRSVTLVSLVICGIRRSEKVEAALAALLGYQSSQHLWDAATANAERKAG